MAHTPDGALAATFDFQGTITCLAFGDAANRGAKAQLAVLMAEGRCVLLDVSRDTAETHRLKIEVCGTSARKLRKRGAHNKGSRPQA